MAVELLLALWIGLGATASDAIEGTRPLTAAEAGRVYEATDFSLEQVGARHLLIGMERDAFVHALVSHHASAPQADRSALRRLYERWDAVQSDWHAMSPSDRRRFVYDVITITYGQAIAAELVSHGGVTAPPSP